MDITEFHNNINEIIWCAKMVWKYKWKNVRDLEGEIKHYGESGVTSQFL